jgi:hypothetical protein
MLKDEALTHFFTNANNLGSSNLLTHIAPSFQELYHRTQSYERRMITEIKWIDGDSNPADAMTKEKHAMR